jgi:rare lipoprotein A (peptidoglycan hydrolase)
VVRGKRYVPMTVAQARTYREKGIASWYGDETYRQRGGHMTANGEAFNPDGLSAAHKHLPLPIFVRVTNLSNRRSIVVRVNDRGPFVKGRIIDLSAGAAKRLGFLQTGNGPGAGGDGRAGGVTPNRSTTSSTITAMPPAWPKEATSGCRRRSSSWACWYRW